MKTLFVHKENLCLAGVTAPSLPSGIADGPSLAYVITASSESRAQSDQVSELALEKRGL